MTHISISSGFKSQKKRKREESQNERKRKRLQIEKNNNPNSKSSFKHEKTSKVGNDIESSEDGTLISISEDLINNIKKKKPIEEDDSDDPDDLIIQKMEKLLRINKKKKKIEENESSKKLTLKEYIEEKRKQSKSNYDSVNNPPKKIDTDKEYEELEVTSFSEEDQLEVNEDQISEDDLEYYNKLDNFLTLNLNIDESEEDQMIFNLSEGKNLGISKKTTKIIKDLDFDSDEVSIVSNEEHNLINSYADSDNNDKTIENTLDKSDNIVDDQELTYYNKLDEYLTSNLMIGEEDELEMFNNLFSNFQSYNQSQKDNINKSSIKESKDQTENRSYFTSIQNKEEQSEEFKVVEKELRIISNKLSHSNLIPLTLEALNLYSSNSKILFNIALSKIIIHSLTDDVSMLGQFILVYAAFVVAIHNIADMEVGAKFMETFVHMYEEIRKERNSKAVMNMTTFFAHLFNMSLFTKEFLYDMIEKLIESIDNENNNDIELEIESIYKLLLSCSIQLRKVDPQIFKRLLNNTVEKLTSISKDKNLYTIKIKTFIELISTIYKRSKREEQQDEFAKYQVLRKEIYQLQQKANAHGDMTLTMTYSDLRDSKTKGRWWIVGTAWKGHEKASTLREQKKNSLIQEKKTIDENKEKLRKLALKQKMNTELRIEIFCAIMSSSNVDEAISKLLPINVIANNREIVRVLLHCCCQEKNFNKYYINILEALCLYKNFNRAIQYVFYERFRDMNTYEMKHITHLCYALTLLIGRECVKLSILKTITFSELKGKSLIFFRFLFTNLFLDYEIETICKIFYLMAKQDDLSELKERLKLFFVSFREKETRKKFLYDFITLRNVQFRNKKNDLEENEKIINSCTKKIMRILSYEPNIYDK